MISSPRVLILLGLAATVATAGACTTGQASAQSTEPPIGAIPTVHSGADIVLPLDTYLLTGQQTNTFSTGVILIGRECMKQFGLSWPATLPTTGNEQNRNIRRYGLVDTTVAKVTGYHPPAIERPAQKKPTIDAMNVWAGHGEHTFAGRPVPDGGCAGEAVRKLSEGAPEADPGIAEGLQRRTYADTTADSRVAQVVTEWSTCMRTKGYDYPNPLASAEDQRWHTAQASPAEIVVATADVDCKAKTKLPGLMMAVETAYQSRLAAQHPSELAAIKSLLSTQLTNAAAAKAAAG